MQPEICEMKRLCVKINVGEEDWVKNW